MTEDLSDRDRLARLRSVRQKVREASDSKFGAYLDMMGLYDTDPVSKEPFVIPSSFIPERVGGSVAVVDQNDEYLSDENLNQFLSNFLPGGYKQRWRDFDLYRGNWHYQSEPGFADVAPMIDRADEYALSAILDGPEAVPYGPMSFDPADVRVYVPDSVQVTNENLQGRAQDVNYVWLPDQGIIWTGDPPVANVRRLSSDPTINVLWFKHPIDDVPSPESPIEESELLTGYEFVESVEFIRCYYASLLTLYPLDTTETMSGIVRYRHEDDDVVAFMGSEEESQLLTFGVDREGLRERIDAAMEADPSLRRDLQVSFLHAKLWEELFFEEEAVPHEFAVEPLVEHLIGVDYKLKRQDDVELGVFNPTVDLERELEYLLPSEQRGGLKKRLRLLGYPIAEESDMFNIAENHAEALARILAYCRNDEKLLDFAEQVAVHSAEHALATWSNEYTGSGTSFELWYDVNFQESDADEAQIAVYDPIQGGAGIAKEVADTYAEDDEADVVAGIRHQSRCHTGAADLSAVELLRDFRGKSLYDLYHDDREAFHELVRESNEDVVDDIERYNRNDLTTQVEHRVKSLLETRELAAFYSYVANMYGEVRNQVERTPRVVDLALHLDQHVFRDPEVRATYERFASDTGRRDLSELGERLSELVVGCIDACPDCLQTDVNLCLHGSGPQHAWLNRRLLMEVFDE